MRLQVQVPRVLKPLLQRARYKGAWGGRGGGKSHFYAELAISRCLGGSRIVCIREVQNSIKDSVRQLLVDKLAKLGVAALFDVTRDEIRGPDGGLIVFRGMNDANNENIKSLEGFDVAWVEEAHTLSQKSLDLLRPTIRKDGSEIWFSWNPRNKTDAVDTFLRGEGCPRDAIVVRVNYSDNPWFPKALYAEMEEDRRRDPVKASHVWDGAYESAPKGNYYGQELAEIETSGRITDLLIDPVLPVHTCWDLGAAGNMATWFFQVHAGQFKWVDYHEYEEAGLPHAASILRAKQAERKWTYGTHLWPHDGSSTDIGSGQRRNEMMSRLGFNVTVLDRENVGDGIEAVRRVLKMSYFDRRCQKGLDHLKGYKRKAHPTIPDTFLDTPDKNGHDHCADAFRTGAMGQNKLTNVEGWDKSLMNWDLAVA